MKNNPTIFDELIVDNFARRYLYSGIYRKINWRDYLEISPDK